MRYLIFDAGPLINFAMNGILPLVEKLKQEFKGEFIITKEVKEEVIDRPLTIKRFELEALQIKQLFDRGIIKHADLNKDEIERLREKRNRLMNLANSMFKARNKEIHLLDKGEAAALSLSLIMKEKYGQETPLVIDERTARMLVENPENLRKLLQKKFHTGITANTESYSYFRDFKIIRSAELIYIASKRKLFEIKDPRIMEAALYGIRYKGCSISEREIEMMKSL